MASFFWGSLLGLGLNFGSSSFLGIWGQGLGGNGLRLSPASTFASSVILSPSSATPAPSSIALARRSSTCLLGTPLFILICLPTLLGTPRNLLLGLLQSFLGLQKQEIGGPWEGSYEPTAHYYFSCTALTLAHRLSSLQVV